MILDALPRGADPAIGSGPVALPAQAVTLHVRPPIARMLGAVLASVSAAGYVNTAQTYAPCSHHAHAAA